MIHSAYGYQKENQEEAEQKEGSSEEQTCQEGRTEKSYGTSQDRQ